MFRCPFRDTPWMALRTAKAKLNHLASEKATCGWPILVFPLPPPAQQPQGVPCARPCGPLRSSCRCFQTNSFAKAAAPPLEGRLRWDLVLLGEGVAPPAVCVFQPCVCTVDILRNYEHIICWSLHHTLHEEEPKHLLFFKTIEKCSTKHDNKYRTSYIIHSILQVRERLWQSAFAGQSLMTWLELLHLLNHLTKPKQIGTTNGEVWQI